MRLMKTMRLMKLCSYRNQYKLEHHMNHNADTNELTTVPLCDFWIRFI